MKILFIVLSVLVAGLASAQPPRRNVEQRLSEQLSLNSEQQNKVHTILAESHVLLRDNMQKTRDLHTALTAAIKSGSEDQIDRISQDIAAVQQQQTAVHAKSMARIYATLTADQKAKIGDRLDMLMGGHGPRGMR